MSIHVVNLLTDDCFIYDNVKPIDALITTYLLENKQASQVSNQSMRESVKSKVIEGKHTLAIDNLCVLKR